MEQDSKNTSNPWEPLLPALKVRDALGYALIPLRGKTEDEKLAIIRAALEIPEYRRLTLKLLGQMSSSYSAALVDDLVDEATSEKGLYRVLDLLARLPYRQAREVVPPAVWRALNEVDADPKMAPVYDIWFRLAALLDHLGLFDALNELVEKSRNHIEGDVRELHEYYPKDNEREDRGS